MTHFTATSLCLTIDFIFLDLLSISGVAREGHGCMPPSPLCQCEHGGVDLMGLKPNPLDLSSFGALTLLVGSFDP